MGKGMVLYECCWAGYDMAWYDGMVWLGRRASDVRRKEMHKTCTQHYDPCTDTYPSCR